jgi:lipopolysaccharide export system permease protein
LQNPLSRIDRYIFWQLLGFFGFFSIILIAVYWVNRAVGLLETLLGDGQTLGVFVQMSLLTIPGVVELIVPMAAFGAAAFTANKLSGDSELVILQATGFSYWRIMRPVLYFGAVVAIFTALVTNYLIPQAAKQLRELNTEISQNTTARYLKEGQFHTPSEGIVVYFRDITDNGELLDIFIADSRNVDFQQIYTAQRAFVLNDDDTPKLLLLDGIVQRSVITDQTLSTSYFSDFTMPLDSLMENEKKVRLGAGEMSTWYLVTATDATAKLVRRSVEYLNFQGHFRITWAVSAAFTAMIGFSSLLVGGFSRQGLWKQISLAIGLLIVMYLVHILTLSNGRRLAGGWALAYLTPLVGAFATSLVIWQAGRPRRVEGASAHIVAAP